MDKIKEVKTMINRELMITSVITSLPMFLGLSMLIIGLVYSIILASLSLIYLGVAYTASSSRRIHAKSLRQVKRFLVTDVDKALVYLEREVKFLNDTLNAPKTEMDVHSLNATNEGSAIRASRRNSITVGKRLGLFINMRDLVREYVNELNKQQQSPW